MVTITGTLETDRKWTERNKIIGIMRNNDSLSYSEEQIYSIFLYNKRNEKEWRGKPFLMNGKIS